MFVSYRELITYGIELCNMVANKGRKIMEQIHQNIFSFVKRTYHMLIVYA